jgi:hypothetical protein
MLAPQVYAAAGDSAALVAFVERYAHHTVAQLLPGGLPFKQMTQQQQQQQQAPLDPTPHLGQEVQLVVAATINAAVEMNVPGLAQHLLRLLPLLGCSTLDEPTLGTALQAAVAAEVRSMPAGLV